MELEKKNISQRGKINTIIMIQNVWKLLVKGQENIKEKRDWNVKGMRTKCRIMNKYNYKPFPTSKIQTK